MEEYNPNKKRKKLIVFADGISFKLSNKKFNPLVTESFTKGKKNKKKSLVFITESSFAVPKNIRLNLTHYFVMKIPNKRELQQIAFNLLSDIDFQDFMKLYRKCTLFFGY